ncbi:MAG: hypothetical protein ACR2RL_09875, partial [Gammaproteobacteria bacterium]
LIAAAAVGRLWGWQWGAVTLVFLALGYHERGAPQQVWLHVLAASALARVLKDGRLAMMARLYRFASLLALIVIAVPFAVNQVRVALYPQLEYERSVGTLQSPAIGVADLAPGAPVPAPPRMQAGQRARELRRESEELGAGLSYSDAPAYPKGELQYVDPDAIVQTGPGLPSWQWKAISLRWNGPVEQGETIRLILVPPTANLALRVLAILLLGALALRVADVPMRRSRSAGAPSSGTASLLVMAFATGLVLAVVPQSGRAELPPTQMLEELRERLLAPPECVPRCAEIPALSVAVSPDRIRLSVEVHTGASLAVPLPGPVFPWTADRILVDGEAAAAVVREPGGGLRLKLDPGIHQIVVEGPLPDRDRVDLALPLAPRHVEATTDGWTVRGIRQNGVPDRQLQLIRDRNEDATPTAGLKATALPPFVRVERTLALGLNWQVFTRVRRLSSAGQSIVLEVPLVEGESVVSENARVVDRKVLVNMGPGESEAAWESVLDVQPELSLTAPESTGATTAWFEQWQLDASPIWHVDIQGIPVVHHQREGRWLPQWRPWPGETVSLSVRRPQGVAGKTLTIQGTALNVTPGTRASDVTLRIHYESSQGGQHDIVIPPEARLTGVSIDGRTQPVRSESGRITLPITPGSHVAQLSWRHSQPLTTKLLTPAIDLGIDSVNANIELRVPRDRWVLFTGGPQLGPAVLIWGVLLVIAAVAIGLGRTRRTPLRWWHWLLLGIGLSQIPVWLSVVVVVWLFALDARAKIEPASIAKWKFNFMQMGLAGLTVVSLGLLFYAVQHGLLGMPEMQVRGNGSSGWHLRWFDDRVSNTLPRAWFISVPTLAYRLLMLVWALWLALALVKWVRWGWTCFSTGGYWRSLIFRKARKTAAAASDAST